MSKLGHKATKSIVTLTSKTFLLNVINFAGAFFLTVYLSPSDFGVFIITSSVIDILAYFSDIGLAGALIQKKGELKDEEISATFTIQMGLVSVAILIASFFAGVFRNTYGLDENGVYLYLALLVAFFFSSLKTIPSVLSEREFKFERIIIPQLIETVIYNGVIIYFAWNGWGIRSYIWAVLARSISGTAIIYLMVKWVPKISFNFKAVKKLLSFGIPYQVNGLIAVFKDRISLLILGGIIGTEGLGVLGWAEKWAHLPLRYFMDPTIKVAFPLFARLQNSKEKARQSLEKFIYFISSLTLPTLAGGFLIMPYVIEIIPRYSKWQPGMMTFNLFLISAAIASVSTFLSNFLTAIGKVKQVMGLMIMWTALTLTLYPILAKAYGYNGVAIASIIVGLSSVITLVLTKRIVPQFNLLKQIYPSIISTMIMILGVRSLSVYFGHGVPALVQTMVSGIAIYGVSVMLIDGKNLINQSKIFIKNIKNK